MEAFWMSLLKRDANNRALGSEYVGKKLSILGSSYELVESKYYIDSEEEIWWKKVCNALGMTMLKNNSIAGSCVAGDSINAAHLSRCEDLHVGDELPDVIIVAMGGNDFRNEIPIGTYDGTGEFPTDTSTFREAYAVMLNKIMLRYPEAEVFVCTRPYTFECNGDVVFPEKNDEGILYKDWNNAIIDIANLFGARIIDQSKCGITWQNRKYFCGDYNNATGYSLHPNKWGHSAMANEVIRTIAPWCTTKYPLREALLPVVVEWEFGTIYKGEEQDSNTRIRTVGFVDDSVYRVSCTSDYEILVCLADNDGVGLHLYYNKSSRSTSTTATNMWGDYFDIQEARKHLDGYKMRLLVKRKDDGVMSMDDVENISTMGLTTAE